jgi:sigma-B regulation protein RsbQ
VSYSRSETGNSRIAAREDAIAPVEVGSYLYRTLPRSTLRMMKATGHCPHVSHPEETIAAMQDFLAAS